MMTAVNMDNTYARFVSELDRLDKIYKKNQEYTVFVPTHMNDLAVYIETTGRKVLRWNFSFPKAVKEMSVEGVVEFLNTIEYYDILTNDFFVKRKKGMNNNMVFLNEDSPMHKLLIMSNIKAKQESLGMLTIVENDSVFGVEYEFYKDAVTHIVYDKNPGQATLIPVSEDYWYNRTTAIQNKFWPHDDIDIYCIPNVCYKNLTEEHVRPGSAVVDLANWQIWHDFQPRTSKKIFLADITNNMESLTVTSDGTAIVRKTTLKQVEYNHSKLTSINKSHLALVPNLCPCRMNRDAENRMRIYFLNVDPVVVKGLFEYYCVGAERNADGEIKVGVNVSVYSIMTILNPQVFSTKPFDWSLDNNHSHLAQYILLGLLLNSKDLLNSISETVIRQLTPLEIKKLKNSLQQGVAGTVITENQLRQISIV